jgi:uncharacterized protein YraI
MSDPLGFERSGGFRSLYRESSGFRGKTSAFCAPYSHAASTERAYSCKALARARWNGICKVFAMTTHTRSFVAALSGLSLFAFCTLSGATGCAVETSEEQAEEDDSLGEEANVGEVDADELGTRGPTHTQGTALTTTSKLNLRESGSLNAEVLRQIPAGAQVSVWKTSGANAWVAVSYQGTRGYAHNDYLKTEADGGSANNSDSDSDGFIAFSWDGKHPSSKQWNVYARDAIRQKGQALTSDTPSDVSSFCPAYSRRSAADKEQFWIGLLSAMTRFESNYNPKLSYTENFRDSQGNRVVSRGLLQLSLESARNYGCVLSSAQALHEPQANLSCGVRIVNRWVERDGVIAGGSSSGWRGAARYWSVLRKQSTLSQIKSMTRALSVCQ